MFRYLALSWNELNGEAAAFARLTGRHLLSGQGGWHCSLDTPGLKVFHVDSRSGSSEVYALSNQRGVVLGKLFNSDLDKACVPEKLMFDDDHSAAILYSRGRWLIDHRWGRYVAFLKNRETRSLYVLRDPTAALPCFMTTFNGVTIWFSYTEDCLALLSKDFSINWRYLAVHCCYPTLVRSHATATDDIWEVQSGECWETRADGTVQKTLYWDPVRIAQEKRIECLEEAVPALRYTIERCIWAWMSCYDKAMHALSGGFDSSLIAFCMNSAPFPFDVKYFTFFNSLLPTGNETKYAELIAHRFGRELVKYEEKAWEIHLDAVLNIPRSANPWDTQYCVTHSHTELQIAREHGANALFFGVGGDQVFYQGPVEKIIGDYVYYHGLGKLLFPIALQVARRTSCSVWSLLRDALREGFAPRWDLASFGRKTELIVSEVAEAAAHDKHLWHVWLQQAQGLPLGRIRHILELSCQQNFYDPIAPPNAPERVWPLMSQPLFKRVLEIATWVLAAQGYDRFAVRSAFSRDLPSEIVWRRHKGVITQLFQELLRHNADFLREFMLDGCLVKEILDRRKVEQALRGGRASLAVEAADIVAIYLGIEAWARQMQGRTRAMDFKRVTVLR